MKFLHNSSQSFECEVLVVVTDRYDFEFSIKAAEIKHRREDSTHIQEIEIIENRNVHSHFKVLTKTPTW